MVLVNPRVMLSYLASEQEDGHQASLQWRAIAGESLGLACMLPECCIVEVMPA